jgi:hypothetical protein
MRSASSRCRSELAARSGAQRAFTAWSASWRQSSNVHHRNNRGQIFNQTNSECEAATAIEK